MRMKRTIHTEKAQAEERSAEAMEIAADTARVEDDAERERAQRSGFCYVYHNDGTGLEEIVQEGEPT